MNYPPTIVGTGLLEILFLALINVILVQRYEIPFLAERHFDRPFSNEIEELTETRVHT